MADRVEAGNSAQGRWITWLQTACFAALLGAAFHNDPLMAQRPKAVIVTHRQTGDPSRFPNGADPTPVHSRNHEGQEGEDPISIPGVHQGPFAVGFETLREYDRSRTYRTKWDETGHLRENARPMLISVWYPADRSAAAPMRFGDYVDLIASVESFSPLTPSHRSDVRRGFATREGVIDQRLVQLLERPANAVRDAARLSSKFPLLIYSPGGGGPPHENALLFEYLASHGYVVAHIPSYARRTFTKGDVAYDLAGVEVGMRDLEFTYAIMRDHPSVNRARVGVLDFSWGGLAAAWFTGHHHDVDVAVSFDGGISLVDLLDGLDTHPQFAPDRMRVPFLHFVSKPIWASDRYRADYHRRIPHPDVYVLRFNELTHNQMASGPWLWEVYAADIAPNVRAAKDGEFAIIARYTKVFLDAYLLGDADARRVLERALANGDPQLGAVSITRSGTGPASR